MPLVVVSANRPYELLGSGGESDHRTVLGSFGTQVRAVIASAYEQDGHHSLAVGRRPGAGCGTRVGGARTGNAGPVQFDIPLREPLIPADPARLSRTWGSSRAAPEGCHGRRRLSAGSTSRYRST